MTPPRLISRFSGSVERTLRPPFRGRTKLPAPPQTSRAAERGRSSLAACGKENGVALIVTLAILAMLTILLVAFVSSVRVERLSSNVFSDQLKARLAAQMAIEQALVDLRNGMPANTPDYVTGVTTNVFSGGVTNCDAFFGTNTANVVFSVNPFSATYLNRDAPLKGVGLTYPSNGISRVFAPWVWYTNAYATGQVSAIRGTIRYAYWIDDESSKINLNTAGVTNKAAFGDLTASKYGQIGVDLRGLLQVGESLGQDIVANRNPPLATVAELGSVPGFDYSKVFSQSAALFATVWTAETERQTNGRLRVNLNDAAFSNVVAGVAVTNFFNAISQNSSVLSNKFGASLWQLAANLRDQLDADVFPTDSGADDPWSTPVYLGIENVPYLNEFVLDTRATVSLDGSNFVVAVTNTAVWEVFNLWQTAYTHGTNVMFCRAIPSVLLTWDGGSSSTNLIFGTAAANLNASIGNYAYAVLSNMTAAPLIYIPTNSVGMPLNISFTPGGALTNLWGATNGANFARFDLAILPARTLALIPISLTVPFTTISTNSFYNASVRTPGDPRVNNTPDDWSAGVIVTLGSQNSTYAPGGATAGDGNDPSRLLSGPGGDGGFPFVGGAFPSAGFLGAVSYSNAFMTLKMYGDGWSNYNSGAQAPDWALLDIFTANRVGAGLRTPGKINVNTMRDLVVNDPSQKGALAALLMRTPINPSDALGGSVPLGSHSALFATVTNVMSGVPYSSLGDLASRVACFTNPPSINADTDWRREAVIRAIANNVTVRGSQFSIWALGQNVSVVRGRTNILGEAMAQAVVDRVEAADATSVTGVTWRVRFLRFLTE